MNAGDANKNTALHMACEDGNLEIGHLGTTNESADHGAVDWWDVLCTVDEAGEEGEYDGPR